VSALARRSLRVSAVEPAGAYTLLRLEHDGGDAGRPGQFFMAQAEPEPREAYLPRALSAAWADERELAFLLDERGPGTRALVRAARVSLLGPLGRGFTLAPGPSVLVAGGIGAAVMPWLARALEPEPVVLLGFRSPAHAACAPLVHPRAHVVVEPALVTEPLARLLPRAAAEGARVYACGPDAMLRAVAALAAEHGVSCELALEAAMACGFGACHGCAVRIDGAWKRLCVEGPVLEAARVLA
jgi:dihydroorotate dehydrogenase electron transfer subunit